MTEAEGGSPPRRDRSRAFVKLGLLAALLLGGVLVARYTPVGMYLSREGVGRAISGLEQAPMAPLVFVAIYALATALAIPGTILTLVGGAVFGVVQGSLLNWTAANVGANAAFGIARLLGREAVEKLTGDRLTRLDRATEDHGFQGLFTLRLIPLVPFNALNFGSGLTALPWRSYAVATAIGILPGTIVYTFFADALLAGSQEASREAFVRVAVAGGLLILLTFLPKILKRLGVTLPGAGAVVASVLFLAPSPGAGDGLPGGGFRPSDPASGGPTLFADVVDHAPFTGVLTRFVDGDGVDYAGLKAEREGLDRYLRSLASVPADSVAGASHAARLAFWINAYNACMLKLVIDHYPIEPAGGLFGGLRRAIAGWPDNSVRQIDDVFSRRHCRVAGDLRSQDDIEHGILRPMGEPRIHFAVNCAARSCPELAREAYASERLEAQLERQVDRFITDPAHFAVEDEAEPTLRLNKVLDWYGEDFGGEEGLVRFFTPRVAPAVRTVLMDEDLEVDFLDYDWTLNDSSPGPTLGQ